MTISKGSTIVCSLLSVHRDPSLWDDPDSFDPKRFLDNDGKFCKVEGFIAFSQGKYVIVCLSRLSIHHFAHLCLKLNLELRKEKDV